MRQETLAIHIFLQFLYVGSTILIEKSKTLQLCIRRSIVGVLHYFHDKTVNTLLYNQKLSWMSEVRNIEKYTFYTFILPLPSQGGWLPPTVYFAFSLQQLLSCKFFSLSSRSILWVLPVFILMTRGN
jgi:hypothetical protein